MQVPRRWGDVDILAIACIEFRQWRAQHVQAHGHRTESSTFESVVIRNGILFRCRVHRAYRSAAFQGHHPLIALHGVGGPRGRGIKGWGKVTRSGLLGTPDLVLLTLNAITRRPAFQPGGAFFVWWPPSLSASAARSSQCNRPALAWRPRCRRSGLRARSVRTSRRRAIEQSRSTNPCGRSSRPSKVPLR